MSKSWRSLYLLCIALLCIKQALSETATMSKEGLQEEHLLPVRMTVAAAEGDYEGSGDFDVVPIHTLNNNVMERMTMKTEEEEDNKVVDSSEGDNSSAETVETIDEGSGFDEGTPKIAAIVEKEANSTTTEATLEETTENNAGKKQTEIEMTTVGEEEEEEVTTAKQEEEETTTIKTIETTTLRTIETSTMKTMETTTEKTETTVIPEAVTEEVVETTTEKKEETTTAAPEVVEIVQEETTARTETTTIAGTTTVAEETLAPTVKSAEPEPVTEVIQVKHVGPVMAAVPTTKIPEEATADVDNGTLHENLTAGTDTLLMKINSRLLDANEAILDNSKDPSRLGTYIVVSLILLSFLSLIGFILMKRRVQKRRKKSNLDQEALDTEKALLSLSEYKDHPDGMDEGKIKNNEITPIVIKSNSQINKFEKNTNFSSPKNLNTKANEKNVEKDNVLKENLTQVIIEDPTKDVEEEKAEKLIVRTHLDQDSIPKKPVIVNRTSLGCVPLSQD
ncbi:UNVERIFIED_CONTAM: hypothetical protein PYX00_010627 [Menopon gallinae]|uniref:Uncharacterized protein n=1 Tax=Menopon gallinae TaxID=328185 RepID=A0AAW2HGB9_9NEOP